MIILYNRNIETGLESRNAIGKSERAREREKETDSIVNFIRHGLTMPVMMHI